LCGNKRGVYWERLFSKRTSKLIPPGSYEEELIADCIEMGMGIRVTHQVVNSHRLEGGGDLVGSDTIWRSVHRLNPVVERTPTASQGSKDKLAAWTVARKGWIAQLLIRFGEMSDEKLETLKVDGILPPYFRIENLTSLTLDQIAWFDETHKKVVIGMGKDFQTKFRRDEHGNLDPNGTVGDLLPTMKVKYPEEVRLMLGLSMKDGNGVRLPLFNYTSKIILTQKDYLHQEEKEMRRVRALDGKCAPWYISGRQAGAVYECELVNTLKHIAGAGTIECNRVSITTVKDFMDTARDNPAKILAIPRISQAKLDDILNTTVLPGEPPPPIDYRKAVNPYLARYSEAEWKEKIDESTLMSKFMCITSLVTHIIETCTEHFADTEYAENWYFYHDALSLMTANETIEWMRQKGYLKRWILPEMELNAGTKFEGRPMGNSPEMMPLDCSCNNDLHNGSERHKFLTIKLDSDDPLKFCLSTPLRGFNTYARVWNVPKTRDFLTGEEVQGGIPEPHRVKHDIEEVIKSMKTIFDRGGAMVPGLGNRGGVRKRFCQPSPNWGGVRVKKNAVDEKNKWTHPDAARAVEKMKKELADRYAFKQER
jgi:hypothetical protein